MTQHRTRPAGPWDRPRASRNPLHGSTKPEVITALAIGCFLGLLIFLCAVTPADLGIG
jgi:hypothetical protein